ncbi:hypothetical protein RJ639_037671 [Escallonia herrerae]|uniref:Pectinesterase n=1 Tax=Escallonia herrerae TaxID=1293975 RepID=A0AA89B6T6_9ASTE|nr:hypothetical protein RJ639_037671 [Escallonia herrerae]
MSLQYSCCLSTCLVLFFLGFDLSQSFGLKPVTYSTISVDVAAGKGNFSTIQSAINSVPVNNKSWTRIYIKAGVYQYLFSNYYYLLHFSHYVYSRREQVTIPADKPFIYVQGEEKGKTQIVWGDTLFKAATFTSLADNIVVENHTFTVKEKPYLLLCLHLSPSFMYTNTSMHPITRNSFNYPPEENGNPLKQALAARISGDKSSFYNCEFTMCKILCWMIVVDITSNFALLREPTISSLAQANLSMRCVDFFMAYVQKCTLLVISGSVDSRIPGYITAQGRSSPNDTDGFVFKDRNVVGTVLGKSMDRFCSSVVLPLIPVRHHSCRGLERLECQTS